MQKYLKIDRRPKIHICDLTKNSDKKLDSKHGQTSKLDKSLKGKKDNQKHARNKAGDTHASVENLKTKHKSNSKHDAVMSMKNQYKQ